MRIRRTYFNLTVLACAASLGGALGYVQDNLTQSLPSLTGNMTLVIYVAGLMGWLAYVLWSLAALHRPSLRWNGMQATGLTLAMILTLWLTTVLGGISFFLINGMDYMTPGTVVLLSAFTGTAYNFVLIVVPLLTIRAVSMMIDQLFTPTQINQASQ